MNRGYSTMSDCCTCPSVPARILRRSSTSPLIVLLVGIFFFCSSQALAGSQPFPVPKWLDRTEVAEKMIVNGIPSTVDYFESYRGVEELLQFYRQQWNDGSNGRSGYREANVASWHVISRLEDGYLYTVQVQKNNGFGIKGYLAVADLKEIEKKEDRVASIPKMSGSRVINDSTSFDSGKKGRTLLLINKYSAASNSVFYRNYYLDRDWGTLVDTDSRGAFVLVFKKAGQETHLVISEKGGVSHVVMNIVEQR